MSLEAMKMALEWYDSGHEIREEFVEMIEAVMRKAIEQAEKQEPVAWMGVDSWGVITKFRTNPFREAIPLYKAPVDAVNMKQERVDETVKGGHEYVIDCPRCGHCCPERKWVGLTRTERFEIEKDMSKYYDYQHECKTVCLPEFAAAIEAALRGKNG